MTRSVTLPGRRIFAPAAAALVAVAVAVLAPAAPTPAPPAPKPATPAPKPATPAPKPTTPAPAVPKATKSVAPAAKAPPKPAAPAGDRLRWVNTFEEAQAQAKKEKKLVLVDFYTDWCGWCRRLDSDVFAKDSFQLAAAGVVGVKVNAEKNRPLAERFGAKSYPRLFFLGADGTTLEEIRGYLSLDDFTAKVKAVKAGDTEYARFKKAAADPTNLGAVHRFAKFLSDSKQLEQAIPYWQQVHDLALEQVFANPNAANLANYHRESLLELGRAYASVGLLDVARQRLEELYTSYPGTPHAAQALLHLGDLEMKAGKHAAARAALQRLVNEAPGSPQGQQAAVMLARLAPDVAKQGPK